MAISAIETRTSRMPTASYKIRNCRTSVHRRRSSALNSHAKYVLKHTGKWTIEHLKGVEGAEETKEVPRIEMVSGIKTIGRLSDSKFPHNKVIINAPTVSGDHARLSILEGQLYCEDLGSTNGTKLNGRKIKAGNAIQIAAGSNLTFGDEYLARYTVYVEEDDPDTVVESPAVDASEMTTQAESSSD